MVETIFSWLFILATAGLSIYAIVVLSRLQKELEKLGSDLNERHSEFQVIWAQRFLELKNEIETMQDLNAIPGPPGPRWDGWCAGGGGEQLSCGRHVGRWTSADISDQTEASPITDL